MFKKIATAISATLALLLVFPTAAHATPGHDLIGVDYAHELGLTGEGLTVAILDDPMNPDHPYFEGKISYGACFASQGDVWRNEYTCDGGRFAEGEEFIAGGKYEDGSRSEATHGQMVSGLIVGNDVGDIEVSGNYNLSGFVPRGIAYNADIAIFGTFDEEDNVVAALEHLAENNDRIGVDVVNISLANTPGRERVVCGLDFAGQKMRAAVAALKEMDVPVFASAGNNGNHYGLPHKPACIDNVYAVGSVTNDGVIQGYSNVGGDIDLFAPSDIPTADYNGYQMGSGTSAASPVATAAYVLLKERFPELRHEIIIDAMKLTGQVLEDTQFTNLRMVDIPAAIDYLDANENALTNGTLVIDREEIAPKHRTGLVPAQYLSTPDPSIPPDEREEEVEFIDENAVEPDPRTEPVDILANPPQPREETVEQDSGLGLSEIYSFIAGALLVGLLLAGASFARKRQTMKSTSGD